MNELKKHHKKIAESLAYQLPLKDFDNNDYIKGKECYDWFAPTAPTKKFETEKNKKYEDQIYEFLETKGDGFPILFIREGLGQVKQLLFDIALRISKIAKIVEIPVTPNHMFFTLIFQQFPKINLSNQDMGSLWAKKRYGIELKLSLEL